MARRRGRGEAAAARRRGRARVSILGPEEIPRVGRQMAKKFAAGAVLIVLLSAIAVSSALLLEVHQDVTVFAHESTPIAGIKNVLDEVPAGAPQTILLLGSDRRFADGKDNPPRSDTIIVVRLDPDKKATAIMSIPRDLKVNIPGVGIDKINGAYHEGGPKLAVRTIRNLLGIPIHHVINVNFGGFARAVNRLGCVYADVDRRYFNDRSGPGGYATIDLKAGYQKLCGQDALDYVRFRHTDSDFVRAARQQEFLRRMKEQIGLGKLFGDRKNLLKIFGRYTQTDISDSNDAAILGLIKHAGRLRRDLTRRARQDRRALHRRPRPHAQPHGQEAEAQADQVPQRARAGPDRRQGGGREPCACDGRAPRRARAAGVLPQGPPRARQRRLREDLQPALVRDLRPQPQPLPRLPDRALRGRGRPVLRRPGDDVEGGADPRQPDRRGADAQAHVSALLRRPQDPDDRLGDAEGRLLGGQLADPEAHEQADDGHRAVVAAHRPVAAARPPRRSGG